tara:strand:+ start:797 stop:1198 length:402 start_codon:yes stop_codon:yes gene_type:complete
VVSKAINVKGLEETLGNLTKLNVDLKLALGAALLAAANDVAVKADTLVPFREGHLKASQSITHPNLGATNPSVKITYGGPSEPYALVQHERLDYAHPGGGQAKYLEEPFLEEINAWPSRFANRVEKEAKRLGN